MVQKQRIFTKNSQCDKNTGDRKTKVEKSSEQGRIYRKSEK